MITSYSHITSHGYQMHLEMIYMLLNLMQFQILTLTDYAQVDIPLGPHVTDSMNVCDSDNCMMEQCY